MAGDRTDPTSHSSGALFATFWVFKTKISSIFWREQQQEAGIPLPPFPVLLRRTAGGTGSTNPPYHTQLLSPSHCFCLAAVSKDHTSPCEAQEASDPHSWSCGWCHILTGRDLLQNSCRTWLCCQARKPQEVFEDESPESVFLDSRPNPVIQIFSVMERVLHKNDLLRSPLKQVIFPFCSMAIADCFQHLLYSSSLPRTALPSAIPYWPKFILLALITVFQPKKDSKPEILVSYIHSTRPTNTEGLLKVNAEPAAHHSSVKTLHRPNDVLGEACAARGLVQTCTAVSLRLPPP